MPQLPIHSVHRIFQDKEGYIWYGTSDGLCRDDGYNVQLFRSDRHTPNAMESSLIYTIAEDGRNRLWLGTEKDVYILDKATYKVHQLDHPETKNRRINTLYATADGCVWVVIPGGLCQFGPDETLKALYPVKYGSGNVEAIYEDQEHTLWVCVGGEGVCKINPQTGSLESYAQKQGAHENYIIQDRKQKYYWVSTWGNGIKRFDPTATGPDRYVPQPATYNTEDTSDNYIIKMVQDDVHGYLWVTTFNNLLAFSIDEQGMLQPVNTSAFLSADNKMLSEAVKDRDQNLWVAAYDRKSFIINPHNSYINEYKVSTLQQRLQVNPAIVSLCKDDEEGLFWISQDRYGVCLYAPGPEEVLVNYNDCPDTHGKDLFTIPYLIKSRKRGKIWAMSEHAWVYGVSHSGLSMKMEESIDLSAITDTPGTLETIFEDTAGNLWMGTTTGLFVYRPNSEVPQQVAGISGNAASITQTADGTVWVCVSRKGVYKIDGTEVTGFFATDRNLSCIDATSDGKLWVGTFSSEILFLDPARGNGYTDYTHICDMRGDVLEMLLVDSFNHVWILTNQQVKEFNPRNNVFRNYAAPRKSFLLDRYLPRAAYKAQDNTMYFGGIPGFISIKASNRLESMPRQVKPIITNVTVGKESLFFDRHLSLLPEGEVDIKPEGHNIEISFSTLDYWNASQIRYAYKLQGVDEDWNYTANGINTAFYNRLDKGEYVFQVKATDENGLWSEQVTTFTIHKLPAWYETRWAYALYILVAGAIIFALLYMYVQRVKQENNRKVLELIAQMKLHYFTNTSDDEMVSQLENILHEHQQKQELFRKTPTVEISRMETPSHDEQLMIKALQVVEANLGVPNFDINRLADELNMTRITLSRKIKAITGQTPLEFIRDIKMKHACRMLQNPAITIGEVVIALGYTDHGYFTTLFKNTFGITPSEYQKRQVGGL